MGRGTKHSHLCQITPEIWEWCENRNIQIFATSINSNQNLEADSKSRILPPETERELANWVLSSVFDKLGMPEIDLFASDAISKCKKFFSWKKDPESISVDAFTFSWKYLICYPFSPFSVILRVLRKIIAGEAEGILIVPHWATQPLYPMFKSLSISAHIMLGPDITLLSSPFSRQQPLSQKLTLAEARLSAMHLRD